MNKKKIAVMITVILAAVIIVAGAIWFMTEKPLDRQITSKGYGITVPRGWTSDADGTLRDKHGTVMGKFLLMNEEPDMENQVSYAGFAVNGNVETEQISQVITKNIFQSEGKTAVQYFIQDIPNPEPYAISITLLRPMVSEMMGDRIAASLDIPEMGSRPPQKKITVPTYDSIGTDKTAVFLYTDGSISEKNVGLIDVFINHQNKKESTGLDVLCYEQTKTGERVAKWSHIESDGGRGYLYSYYDCGNGIFTYDNNPLIFDSITKTVKKDKGTTSYLLKSRQTQTQCLLEIPINPYRDYAETLSTMRMSESTEVSAERILEVLFTPEQRDRTTVVRVEKGLKISVTPDVKIDREKLSKDVTVLFALLTDIDVVTVEHGGNTFVFRRDEMLEEVAFASKTAADSPESFIRFSETIEAVFPAISEEEKAQGKNVVSDGNIIYSSVVMMTPATRVPHPRTGEMVAVGPYAERMGVTQYLNKPITCTIKRNGSAYIVTAASGGSIIYTYPLENEAAVQDAIRQLKAYS